MGTQLLHLQKAAFLQEIPEDTKTTFFKCIRWQVEETMDPITCPYHYFCNSTYPGNFPPYVDILVFIFVTVSYSATLLIMALEISRARAYLSQSKRYLLPSGPVLLPIFFVILAKGYRINTVFPLTCIGPAILQLLQVSALTLDNGVNKDVRSAFFETSAISGILHVSLYLDSIVLPYYTGLDALVSSNFSGECQSCVCRREALLVGGRLVKYRGWSATTFLVVAALCLRIISRMTKEHKGKVMLTKSLLECLGWVWITFDCLYLIRKIPPELTIIGVASLGGILLLICLHLIKVLTNCIRTTLLSRFGSNWKQVMMVQVCENCSVEDCKGAVCLS